jgi:hypothetical protein
MKSDHNHKLAVVAAGACLLSNFAVRSSALRYMRAAKHDEDSGFPYTAAMEWRNAAELFSLQMFGEYCWRQWERIMHLPRRLAEPIDISQVGALPLEPISAARPATPAMRDSFSLLSERREEWLN